MTYTKRDVIERSGLADRTIRNYVKRGLLPAPVGHGLAAEYNEEYMVRAVAIGRMRAEGEHIDVITERIAGWTTAQFKRFVKQTEPRAPAPPPAPAPPTPPPVASPQSQGAPPLPVPALQEAVAHEGEPVTRAAVHQESRHDEIADGELPDAPCWRIYSLITGIGLMVDVKAPPIVQRIAAEILARYGPR
ncbi:MAG TPA: MerR family transcriptional regulator [Polyangiaceae bacterium]|jgi:DNA-binding transcriptional MerR regulator|nr:MerR family transcriptional regulator [Polyangiaceae bacterium]